MQVCKQAFKQVCRNSSMNVCKIEVYKYENMQVCKYASMQECNLLLAICDFLSVTCYMLLANWIFYLKLAITCKNFFLSLVVVRLIIFYFTMCQCLFQVLPCLIGLTVKWNVLNNFSPKTVPNNCIYHFDSKMVLTLRLCTECPGRANYIKGEWEI